MNNNNIVDRIKELKIKNNAIILAHYYQPLEIQLLADIVGDSLELARKSKNTDADVLVFCGVSFMGESAALLCPDKKVLLPAPDAGCDMADTITPKDIVSLKIEDETSFITIRSYHNSLEIKQSYKKGDIVYVNISKKNNYYYLNSIKKLEG